MTTDKDKSILQGIFDKVCNLLILQGKGSFNGDRDGCIDNRMCAYRGPEGLKCAVGQLLTDEQIAKYHIREGNTPNEFPEELIKELLPEMQDLKHGEDFLRSMQRAHDNATLARPLTDSTKTWVAGFKLEANLIAGYYGLTPIA